MASYFNKAIITLFFELCFLQRISILKDTCELQKLLTYKDTNNPQQNLQCKSGSLHFLAT